MVMNSIGDSPTALVYAGNIDSQLGLYIYVQVDSVQVFILLLAQCQDNVAPINIYRYTSYSIGKHIKMTNDEKYIFFENIHLLN